MSLPTLRHLAGAEIDLVEIAPEHFPKIIAWRNAPENRRYFFDDRPWSLQGQHQWYAHYQADPTDLTYTILWKRKSPVGMVALYHIDPTKGTAEFGRLLIGEAEFRRQGIGYAASYLLLAAAFEQLHLHTVVLEVYSWNHAAIQLYRRLGFVTVGGSSRQSYSGEQAVTQMQLLAHHFQIPLSDRAHPLDNRHLCS
jgi:diamine N-acetyltransferase